MSGIKIIMAHITHVIIYLVIVVQVLQFAMSFGLHCKEYIHVYTYVCARARMYVHIQVHELLSSSRENTSQTVSLL